MRYNIEHKEDIIKKIKTLVDKNGVLTPNMINQESIVLKIMNNHNQLIEVYNHDEVTVCEYVHETEINEFELEYKRLSKSILKDILMHLEDYDIDLEKTYKRCDLENKF